MENIEHCRLGYFVSKINGLIPQHTQQFFGANYNSGVMGVLRHADGKFRDGNHGSLCKDRFESRFEQ